MRPISVLDYETRVPVYLALVISFCSPYSEVRSGSARYATFYDGVLPRDVEVNTFRHIDRVFPSAIVKHGGHAFPLPAAARQLRDVPFTSLGQQFYLADYIRLNRVAGLLVLKDGKIALERYEFGNTPQTRWVSFSVVKSITSTLAAAAIQDGLIGGLDDPVTKYLPQLYRSGYDGVSIRNLLQMASGVRWNDTYTSPSSDRRRMLDLQREQVQGCSFSSWQPCGALHDRVRSGNYNTRETYVLGALVRAAVRRTLSQYLSDKMWSSFAMGDDTTWWTESPGGVEFGGSGFAAKLQVYARFGEFVLQRGLAGGKQVVPDGWLPDAGQPKPVGGEIVPYGYMW